MVEPEQRTHGNGWAVIQESIVDENGFRQPGFKAKIVEGVSKETIKGDVVIIKRFFPDSHFEEQFYIPKEVFTKTADQLQ